MHWGFKCQYGWRLQLVLHQEMKHQMEIHQNLSSVTQFQGFQKSPMRESIISNPSSISLIDSPLASRGWVDLHQILLLAGREKEQLQGLGFLITLNPNNYLGFRLRGSRKMGASASRAVAQSMSARAISKQRRISSGAASSSI